MIGQLPILLLYYFLIFSSDKKHRSQREWTVLLDRTSIRSVLVAWENPVLPKPVAPKPFLLRWRCVLNAMLDHVILTVFRGDKLHLFALWLALIRTYKRSAA